MNEYPDWGIQRVLNHDAIFDMILCNHPLLDLITKEIRFEYAYKAYKNKQWLLEGTAFKLSLWELYLSEIVERVYKLISKLRSKINEYRTKYL